MNNSNKLKQAFCQIHSRKYTRECTACTLDDMVEIAKDPIAPPKERPVLVKHFEIVLPISTSTMHRVIRGYTDKLAEEGYTKPTYFRYGEGGKTMIIEGEEV
jgi:hypothetical protein